MILDVGKVEALLPPQEQAPGEHYRVGQRLKVLMTEISKTPRGGMQVTVSRTHTKLVKRLFELEVPEIYTGAVEIKAIARDPGVRTKVAVAARQEGVDPVGACVGQRGVRIQNVVNELNGEKIDVARVARRIPQTFVANALRPADGARGDHRRGQQERHGGGARAGAVPGDRQGRAECPPGRAADRLAHRYQAPSGPDAQSSHRPEGGSERGGADGACSLTRRADGKKRPKPGVGKHVPSVPAWPAGPARPKRHLVRLVRTPEDGGGRSRTGRQPGRGAYLCPAQECWRLAKQRKSLDQALEITT